MEIKKPRRALLLIIGIMCSAYIALSSDMTQTIRGTVTDQETQSPLIGATIQVVGSNPLLGAVADINGEFRINNVPVGRVTLVINYLGYEEQVIPNLLVTSAKEVILNSTLIESIEKMEELVVTAKKNKAEVLNEMSVVSARSFTVEETKRYAGSFADPARMVSSFAGVTNQAEGNNDIIVRGNSPRGILWKLEGIEIPNPNHFANEGATGGPINALNSNMLSNSDFMSGAFAPEYGNALSGVFDMKLKKGNNERREYTATASTLGLDFTAEGPFKAGYDGSFIANYRYSSLALVDAAGVIDFGGVPKYQDASFKVHLPINKSHYITAFGLGGMSGISTDIFDENDESRIIEKSEFGADMGVMAITHNFLIDNNSFLKTTISAAGSSSDGFWQLPEDDNSFFTAYSSVLKKTYLRGASTYNRKFNAAHKMEVGVIYSSLGFDMLAEHWNFHNEETEIGLQDKGTTYSLQGFLSWKYRLSETVTLTNGLHYMQLGLNNANSIEPRSALKWEIADNKALTLGFGLHSRLESASTYLAKVPNEDGSLSTPNENLGLSKAAHYVIGYDHFFGPNLHMKAEAYYQYLFDVPIENVEGSYYSTINSTDGYNNTELVNQGTGRNYGLELTVERFLQRGFYFLSSASLYKTYYTAMDGIERETAFSGNYIFNFLSGKEWSIGKPSKNKVLFLNGKISLIGGKPYTPIDIEASRELGNEVLQEDRPWSVDGDDIFILNFSVGTRRNKGNTTREFKIDIQNATNNQAVVDQYYINATGAIEKGYQLPFFPTISYAISF